MVKKKIIRVSFKIVKSSLRFYCFFYSHVPFKSLENYNFFSIIKTGSNLFINWIDPFGRLKSSNSLMTLTDTIAKGKARAKKQRAYSTYFLIKKYCYTFIKKKRIHSIALYFKGSLGIRRKRAVINGVIHSGLKPKKVIDVTNVPFNGCRLKKAKRK